MNGVELLAESSVSTPWLRLRAALWPDTAEEEHLRECADVLSDPAAAVFVARRGACELGFAEVTAHAAPPGLPPGRVGFLEGIYVAPVERRSGLGRELVLRAREWARVQGCERFASDTEPENLTSRAFHAALGFREELVGRELVLFELDSRGS